MFYSEWNTAHVVCLENVKAEKKGYALIFHDSAKMAIDGFLGQSREHIFKSIFVKFEDLKEV